MRSTVLFQNVEFLFLGFGFRLCRILTLFCSLRVRFKNETYILNRHTYLTLREEKVWSICNLCDAQQREIVHRWWQ